MSFHAVHIGLFGVRHGSRSSRSAWRRRLPAGRNTRRTCECRKIHDLVTAGINDDKAFGVHRTIPQAQRHGDEYTYSWCHGGPDTSLLFAALRYARVDHVAGESMMIWHRRSLDSVPHWDVPERLHPGFCDND